MEGSTTLGAHLQVSAVGDVYLGGGLRQVALHTLCNALGLLQQQSEGRITVSELWEGAR